ncbi:MAG TPA: c-type cytochrome [Thermoanaerobaculia bacterium]|nr:c-type cytochrome [Thermoanaerobaculia bacterium]
MKRFSLLFALLALGCQSAPTASPVAAPKSEFKNLQVLHKDIQKDQLLAAMRGFTRGLGVRCDHCHVQIATDPKPQFDFPNDEKETKRAAREMIRMVAQINGTWIPRVEAAAGDAPPPAGAEPETHVSCWTCHRGQEEPESQPPPQAR